MNPTAESYSNFLSRMLDICDSLADALEKNLDDNAKQALVDMMCQDLANTVPKRSDNAEYQDLAIEENSDESISIDKDNLNLLHAPQKEKKIAHTCDLSVLNKAFSFDVDSGEDLLGEKIKEEITFYESWDPEGLQRSHSMDDLALSIIKKNEPEALIPILEWFQKEDLSAFQEHEDIQYFVKALKNEYSFLKQFASDRNMHEVEEILEICVGNKKNRISRLNFFYDAYKQLNKEKLTEGSLEVKALAEIHALLKPGYELIDFSWVDLTEQEIAEAITKCDLELFQNIDWEIAEEWLKTTGIIENKLPLCLMLSSEEGVDWILSPIEDELDEKRRGRLIDKIIRTGLILMEQKNFQGASQIAFALNTLGKSCPDVQKKLQDIPNLLKQSDRSENMRYFRYYDIVGVRNSIPEDEEEIILVPISLVFWVKLKVIYEQLPKNEVFQIFENPLFARILKNYERAASQTNVNANQNDVNDSTLCKKSILQKKVNLPTDIFDWSIVKLKELMKDWPVKTQSTVLKHYLKHYITKNYLCGFLLEIGS